MHIAKIRAYFDQHPIGKPWACVTVRAEGKRLVVVPGSIGVLKSDALVMPLPLEIEVCEEGGWRIRPERKFYITTETFDPYHALTDGCP